MQKRIKIVLIFMFSRMVFIAQMPGCPSPLIFMDGGSFIQSYDPSQPLSTSNPSSLNVPSFGSGLTLMPNINGGTLCPTFYTTSGGNYYYWSGASWVNTGHSTGNTSAVNIAGCNGGIYNLVGSTGQVYFYNGTANGSLVTTLSGFNSGGPFDLVTDCSCNFYALNTTVPNQALTMYNSSGTVLNTYTLSGMPNAAGGGGFAIIGSSIYVKNNTSGGFYVGTIAGNGITFTAVTGFNQSPGDFASCPICTSAPPVFMAIASGGLLTCATPTVNVVATALSSSPVTYAWTGPGVVGASTNSVVAVNAPGVYTCVLTTGSCPPSQITVTTNVLSSAVNVPASITPSGNICVSTTGTTQLSVAHAASTDVINWMGAGIGTVTGTDQLNVINQGSYTVTVTDLVSGCTGSDVVSFVQSPSVSLALSDNTLCLHAYNGSPASITITPLGANNYTLFTSSNYSTSSPNGTIMPCYPTLINGNLSPLATATLVGATAFCTDTAITSFSIIPNPTVNLQQTVYNICPGTSKAISVNGASQYVWGGSAGLDTYSGNAVVASPSANAVYSVMGGDNGCQSITKTISFLILPIPSISVSPVSSTICLSSVQSLTASGSATSFTWSPANTITGASSNSNVITVSPPNTQMYTVVGGLNSCTNSANALVTIVQPPVLSMAMSSHSFCAQNFQSSPISLTVFPSGTTNYTLLAGGNVNITSPNGPVMQLISSGAPVNTPALYTATLIGQTGVCRVTTTDTFVIVPNPVITIGPASASICPGQSKTFSVTGASSYTWLPMPNYTLTAPNSIVAKPQLTSFYSVIGSSVGCNSALKNAVLVLMPSPSVSLSPTSATVCSGNPVMLTANGNGSSYNWSPTQFLSSTFGTVVVASPTITQHYTVVTTLNTCTSQAVATVSAITIPTLIASTSQPTVCSGSSTQLNVMGANSFQWFPTHHLNAPSGNMVIASPDANTTYTIRGYNGICTGSTTLNVYALKRPDMTISAPYNQICSGGAVPISVSGAQSYTWMPEAGLIPTGTNTRVIASPVISTNYTVFGSTSSGSVSCFQQLSYSIMVVADIKPLVTKNMSICMGEKTTLYASGGNTYSWTPATGLNITNASGVVAAPKVTTVYTVEVSDNSYCGQTTTVMVSVNPVPEVFAGRDTTYNLNDPITVTAMGSGTLTWVSGPGIVCNVCPETQIYPTRSSCYFVEALNEYGCKAVDDICIELTEEFTIYIPNSFTPNNDGLNDVFLIFGENISEVSMEIYDRWGHSIFNSNDFRTGWDGTLKGINCQPGTYTYVIMYTGLNRKKYTKTGNVILTR